MRKKENRKRYEFLFAGLLLLGGVFFIARFFMVERQIDNPPPASAPVVEEKKTRRLIDGVLVTEAQENPSLAGVMVENMEEAQPISGIADAALVFEAVTEANITRFLAYFILDGEIEIGPVRSARPYFLDWAGEFGTLYAHVGSSPAAYDLLRRKGVEGVQDLDQWYNSQYFFRKAGRPKPHHLYTNTELLGKAYNAIVISTKRAERARGEISSARNTHGEEIPRGVHPDRSVGARNDRLESWKFKNDASPDLRGDVREITIGYVAPYEVTWLYDKFDNLYKRIQWARPNFSTGKVSVGQGGLHTTADGKAIIAKNIAVAFQDMKILDEVGRKEFATIGQGKGLVFQDGRVVAGEWRKSSPTERMRFYDAQGNEVEFNGGATWVEIVPKGYKVQY